MNKATIGLNPRGKQVKHGKEYEGVRISDRVMDRIERDLLLCICPTQDEQKYHSTNSPERHSDIFSPFFEKNSQRAMKKSRTGWNILQIIAIVATIVTNFP